MNGTIGTLAKILSLNPVGGNGTAEADAKEKVIEAAVFALASLTGDRMRFRDRTINF